MDGTMDKYLTNRNVAKAIREKHLIQKDCARKCGMSPQVFSRIVLCRRLIKADEILPICKALGITVGQFYEGM